MGLLEGFPELINLDDKKWEDLVDDARRLLARYGKDWTDHNVHDPGITFVELFAWLAEMQIYHLNRVTDANYKKFLKLVGIYPAGAEPARVDISFKDVTGDINAGEPFLVEIGGEKIYFETEEKLIPTSAVIKKIITITDSQIIDNTSANEKDDVYFAPFGEKVSQGAMFKLGFDKPLETEVKITFVLFDEDLPSPGSHVYEPAQIIPSAKLVWEYYDGNGWKGFPIKRDTTLAFNRSGRIVFDDLPDMKKDNDGFYWIRCRLKEGNYEIVPLVNKILLNTISAVQIERINENLGTGNGKPACVMKLKKNPAVRDAMFRADDIVDWITFLNQLKDQDKKKQPSPGKRILSKFDPKTLTLIKEWKDDKEPDDALKYAAIESLNSVLECRDLYDSESFRDVNLADVHRKILTRKSNVIPIDELKILIRYLIEAAYPDSISKKRLIIQVNKGYLFSWDKIPGNDNVRLIEILTHEFDIDWAKTEKIEKIDDGMTIRLTAENNSLSLKLNIEKTKVNLEINDIRTDEFDARIENGELSIYRSIENSKWENWYQVEDFRSTGPDDTHYIFNSENNEITFGNGLNGRIPGEKENIKASYITTLGLKGNIPKEQKFIFAGLGNIQGNNLKDAAGGKDAESIEHAKARAKKDCREIYRAITSEDYEDLASKTPGLRISRVKAIPNYNPDYPCVAFPNAVSVVVVPYIREGSEPAPGEEFLRTVSNHLDRHRLVTADVHVIKPDYIKICVKCKVKILKKSSEERVAERINKELTNFLNPIKGGPEGKGWTFGRHVYPSEIYQKIDEVDGVDYTTDVLLSSFAENYSIQYQKDAIRIPAFGLVISGEHQIEFI